MINASGIGDGFRGFANVQVTIMFMPLKLLLMHCYVSGFKKKKEGEMFLINFLNLKCF